MNGFSIGHFVRRPEFGAVLSFVGGDYVAGLSDFVRAILIVVAIAVGLGTVNALTHMWRRMPD